MEPAIAVTAPIPAATLKDLAQRSDRAGLTQLAGHLMAILLAGLLLGSSHGWWALPAMLVLGVLLVALFAPLHETTHRTPFRSPALNRAVGWVAGLVLVLPPEGFRLFHLAHHRFTQDPTRDPELLGAAPLTPGGYAWKLTGIPYWGAQVAGLLRTAAGHADEPWLTPARRPAVIAEARTYLAIYVAMLLGSLASGTQALLWWWVGPVLLGQPLLRWVLLAEHGGIDHHAPPLSATRTTLAGRAMAWLFWNANFHAEHHLAPGVPFHALPALHRVIRGELGVVAHGYPDAHRAVRSRLA